MLDFIIFTAGEKTVSVSFKHSVIRGIIPQSVEVYAGQTKDHGYQLLGKVPVTVTNTTPAIHKRIAGTVSILVRKCRLCAKEKGKSQLERKISKLHILYLILCFSVLFLALGGIRLSLTVHAISNNLDDVVSNIDLICHLIENLCKTTQNDSVFHALSHGFFL